MTSVFEYKLAYDIIKPRKQVRYEHWFDDTRINKEILDHPSKTKMLELKKILFLWNKNIIKIPVQSPRQSFSKLINCFCMKKSNEKDKSQFINSSEIFGISLVISSGPNLVCLASISYFSMCTDVYKSSVTILSLTSIASS